MSSDILSCERDYTQFAMFYAGAQKNLGPSGMAVVAIRKEFAARGSQAIPTMMQYRTFVDNDSLYNTPPCWSIYVFGETLKWVKKMGKENLFRLNDEKARKIYDVIDATGFYRGTALKEFRSNMNVTWRLPTEELEAQFIKEAAALGMSSLKGHRSVGGVRASIYNAFPMEGVDALVDFMKEFEKKNG
jgi:phosphoserine aminotransferase